MGSNSLAFRGYTLRFWSKSGKKPPQKPYLGDGSLAWFSTLAWPRVHRRSIDCRYSQKSGQYKPLGRPILTGIWPFFALYNLIGPLHCATTYNQQVYSGAQKLQNRRLILDDRPNLLQNSTNLPLASTKMGQKGVRRVKIDKTSGSFWKNDLI